MTQIPSHALPCSCQCHPSDGTTANKYCASIISRSSSHILAPCLHVCNNLLRLQLMLVPRGAILEYPGVVYLLSMLDFLLLQARVALISVSTSAGLFSARARAPRPSASKSVYQALSSLPGFIILSLNLIAHFCHILHRSEIRINDARPPCARLSATYPRLPFDRGTRVHI